MSTFDTLQTEVKARLGNRTDIGTRSAIWLNDALYEIAHNPRFSFRELDSLANFNSVIGTDTYLFSAITSSSFWFALNVYSAVRKLEQVHYETLIGNVPDGDPTKYALYGNVLLLWPVPNVVRTYAVTYRKRIDQMTTGSAFPLGREWEEACTVLAVIKGLEALQRFEEASQYRQIYEAIQSQRLDHLGLEEAQYETTIGVRFS